MGRVYNALVRAEKVKDGDRPIGRLDRHCAGRGRGGDAAKGPSVIFRAKPAAAFARRAISMAPARPSPVVAFEEPSDVSNLKDPAIAPLLATLTGENALAAERYRTLAVKLPACLDVRGDYLNARLRLISPVPALRLFARAIGERKK